MALQKMNFVMPLAFLKDHSITGKVIIIIIIIIREEGKQLLQIN